MAEALAIYEARWAENDHWYPDRTLYDEYHAEGRAATKRLVEDWLLNPPDIAFDGIADPRRSDRGICIREGEEAIVMNLDAANEFENLKINPLQFDCVGVKVELQ